jgi:hypothetical protein
MIKVIIYILSIAAVLLSAAADLLWRLKINSRKSGNYSINMDF